MPVRVVCPECGATATLDEDSPDADVACRQCGKPVPFPAVTSAGPPPLPGARRSAPKTDPGYDVVDNENEDEDDRPSRRRRDDDEDDSPRSRRRPDTEDEDDDSRTRRRRRDDDEEEEDDSPRSRRRRVQDEDEELPRSRSRRDDEDENDEDDSPRSRRRRNQDDEDEDDDSPRSKRRQDDGDEDDSPRSKRRRDEEDEEEEVDSHRSKSRHEDEDEEDEPRSKRRRDEDEDEEDDQPARRSATARVAEDTEDEDDEEDDSPRAKRRTPDDDEEEEDDEVDDRPRRRRTRRAPARSSKTMLLVAGLLAFLGLGIGGGAAAYFLWSSEPTKVADAGDGDHGQNPDANPPMPAPLDLVARPVAFEGDLRGITLPGPPADICPGAAGRLLFLHCPEQRKLVVFDVSEAVVVKEIATNGPDTHFAASATKLLVADNAARTIRRFDLVTLKQDHEAPFPFDGPVKAMAVGHESEGPVLVLGDEPADEWPVRFVDVQTLGLAEVGWDTPPPSRLPRNLTFRAAGNGSRWVGWSVAGVVVVTRAGKRLTAQKVIDQNPGYAALTADGEYLLSHFAPTPVLTRPMTPAKPDSPEFITPAVTGPLYVHVTPAGNPGDTTANVFVSATRMALNPQGLAGRGGVPRPYAPGDAVPPDRRIHFVPEAHALVVVPPGGNQLEVFKFDLATVGKLGDLVAVVTSTPPAAFTPGKPFAYDVKALTGVPEATFTLTGPPGATVSPTGQVRWDPPADLQAERINMRVEVQTARAGVSQALALYNTAAPAPNAVMPKPKTPVEPKPKEKEPKSPEPKVPVVTTPPHIAPGAKLVTTAATPPIQPLELATPFIEVAIPGQLRDVCVGGGGRFLILHCQTARKLAIFDLSALKVVKALPLGSDNVLFAAGADKLLVVYPDEKLIERWNLLTLKIETEAPLEVRQKPTAAAMGSATAGPLVLGGPQAQNNASKMALMFVDVETLKEVMIEKATGDFGVTFGTAAHLRASADGRLLGSWFAQLQPSGLQTARLEGNSMTGSHKRESVGHVIPGPDGQMVFTEKGMYTSTGEPTGRRDPVIPAATGPAYLTVIPDGAKRVVGVWMPNQETPAATFTDLPGFDGRRDPFERDNPTLALDKRLFLIPPARVLVVVPPAADRLLVYKVEASLSAPSKKARPMKEAPSTGDDILSVTSTPPATVKKGGKYTYQVAVKSQSGGVKYRFTEWATGMTVSAEGLVSWTVPELLKRSYFDIKLRITDANGHQIEHKWRIDVVD